MTYKIQNHNNAKNDFPVNNIRDEYDVIEYYIKRPNEEFVHFN